jgi:low affinity Fe/Cu permease
LKFIAAGGAAALWRAGGSFGTASRNQPVVSSSSSHSAEDESMKKQAADDRAPTVHDHFGRFASVASGWLGSTWAFVGAGLVIVVWAATGPMFHYSGTWTQVISTGAALMTFLMVFLIQNTQNRDARAINLKLNELIRAMDKARNQMIDIERLTDLELDEMQATYEKLKSAWTDRQAKATRVPQNK